MDDNIKKIAALIGHHQQQERQIKELIDALENSSARLSGESHALSKTIHSLGQVSGRVPDMLRYSVSSSMKQVLDDIKQAALVQQQPASDALNQIIAEAKKSVDAIQQERARFSFRAMLWTFFVSIGVLATCFVSFTYFMDRGYSRIAAMKAEESMWLRRAPLADISQCDGKPCVKVDDSKRYGDSKNIYYVIE